MDKPETAGVLVAKLFVSVAHHNTEPLMRISFLGEDELEYIVELPTGAVARMLGAVASDLKTAVMPPDAPLGTKELSAHISVTKATCGLNAASGDVTLRLTGRSGGIHEFELSPTAAQTLLGELETSCSNSAFIQRPAGKLS